MSHVFQIGLERGSVRHREQAVVPLFTLRLLLDLKNSDGPASKDYPGQGLRIVDHQNVERIAIPPPWSTE